MTHCTKQVPAYTWAGAGSLNELHWRATFVNYAHQPILFGMRDYRNYVAYWCEHLGIGEQEGNLNVKVYPNPVTECSVMELPTEAVYPAQLIVSDPVGRVVYFDANIRQTHISMYNMNLIQGIYMYTIKDAQNKTSIGKFIVQE